MLPESWTHSKNLKKLLRTSDEYGYNSVDKLKAKDTSIEILKPYKKRSMLDLKNKSATKYDKPVLQLNLSDRNVVKVCKNNGYVSHLFSLLRKNQGREESQPKQAENKTVTKLKQQLSSMGPIMGQMAPTKIRVSNKSIKKRTSISSLSRQKNNSFKAQNLFQTSPAIKQLKQYSKFIESKTPYYPKINYNSLRSTEKLQSFGQIDIKQYKIIESTILCLIDSLNGDQPSSESLMIEYCGLYLQNQERRKFQVIANFHVFKSLSHKIKSAYAYARIWIYLVALLAEGKVIFMQGVSPIALNGCILIDRFLKALFEGVSQTLYKNSASVLEAFKSLKIVKEIQKIISEFETLLANIEKRMKNESESIFGSNLKLYSYFTEILDAFHPFLKQNACNQSEQSLSSLQMALSWKYLKLPPIPFLPQKNCENKYTLVIGLNKVIVLYNPSTRVLKYRPYMDTFLSKIKQHFEIIIFSDFEKQLTDRIVKQIEKEETFFSARLYRAHMSFKNGKMVKDISNLGRTKFQTILIDSDSCFLGEYPDNQLSIQQFKQGTINSNSQNKEKVLLSLLGKLTKIHEEHPKDVRKLLKKTGGLYNIPQVATIEEQTIQRSRGRSAKKVINQDLIVLQ